LAAILLLGLDDWAVIRDTATARDFAVLTQIYEISSPDEARAISEIGIDHIGVLVGDGEFPREQPLARAQEIVTAIAAPAKFSALFLTARAASIIEWARALKPAIVHLGASPELLGPAEGAMIKTALPGRLIMRSVAVSGGKRASIPLEAIRTLRTISCWIVIARRTSKSEQLACRTTGTSVGGSSNWSAPRSSWPEALAPIM
jgi:hypothetical protein